MFILRSPLAQFDVASAFTISGVFGESFAERFYSVNYYITNFSITLIMIFILLTIYLWLCSGFNHLVPTKFNYVNDSLFLFVYDMVQSKIGKKGLKFIPFAMVIFLYILFLNLESLLPYSFAVTTHIIWTITFTLSILSGLLLLGIYRHRANFINMFIPDVPKFLYPLIIPLEMLSYVIRGFSLAIRLSANVLAGHTLTHIIADTVKMLGLLNVDLAIVSIILLLGITAMELGVACLQAYIFTLLIVIYINDVYNLSH